MTVARTPTTGPGRTAVVTGAAGGIGRALAVALHARGTDLVLADIDADALAARVGRLAAPGPATTTGSVTGSVTDVGDQAAVDALAARAPSARLVCLNAGIVGAALGAPWEVPPAEWDRVFAVNVNGVVNGLRAFVPRRAAAGEPAHVLVTASLAGLAVFPGGGAYGPSKHAVAAVVAHAAMALADTPVRVSMICPALVATGMSAEGTPPAEVAEQALGTVDGDTFAVVPAAWRQTVVSLTERLVSGHPPAPPVPR